LHFTPELGEPPTDHRFVVLFLFTHTKLLPFTVTAIDPSDSRHTSAQGKRVTLRVAWKALPIHVLRHSTAVHLPDSGEAIDFVRDFPGRRAIQSTLVYGQVSDARRTRVMRRLERSNDFALSS
jgi:hypothetical protein